MLFHRLRNKLPIVLIILLSPIIVVFNLLLVLIMFLDPRARKFDKQEARAILSEELEKVRKLGYAKLREIFIEKKQIKNFEITATSGVDYQVEIQGWWDGEPDNDILISGGIDNGGLTHLQQFGN